MIQFSPPMHELHLFRFVVTITVEDRMPVTSRLDNPKSNFSQLTTPYSRSPSVEFKTGDDGKGSGLILSQSGNKLAARESNNERNPERGLPVAQLRL
ncbi:MAG: hypothetical protein AB8B55_24165 [Mariniblastus sp.]